MMYGRLCQGLKGNLWSPPNGYTRSNMKWMTIVTNTRQDLWLEGSPRFATTNYIPPTESSYLQYYLVNIEINTTTTLKT